MDERNQERNNQLAFDVAEREFGISPCMTGKEMTSVAEPDKLSMVMYLSQFYEMFKDTVPPVGESESVQQARLGFIAMAPLMVFVIVARYVIKSMCFSIERMKEYNKSTCKKKRRYY